MVKLLLDRGAQPTGLYAAGWWEDIDILNLLVDAGASPDIPDRDGVTARARASRKHHQKFFAALR